MITIDKSFVRTTTSGARPAVLRSMIGLAHDLGMEVVAEGAELELDAVELHQLGCEYVQGSLFGEPLASEAARERIVKERLALVR